MAAACGWWLAGCAGAPCSDLKPAAALDPAVERAAREAAPGVAAVCRRPYDAQAGIDLVKAWNAAKAGLPAGDAGPRQLAWDLCRENQERPFDRETWAAFTDDLLAHEPWYGGGVPAAARLVTFDPASEVGRKLIDRQGEGHELLGEVKNCAGLADLSLMDLSARVGDWERRTEATLRQGDPAAADRFTSGIAASSPLEPGCNQAATDLKNRLEWLLNNLRPMIR